MLSKPEAQKLLKSLPEWAFASGGKRIRRQWQTRDFASGVEFIQRVGELAENEGHHPDLHLVDYRKLTIELSTHGVRELTENEFILAAKIDALPIELQEES